MCGEPWELAGGELTLKARDDSDRQRWIVDAGLIRHYISGKALDANF